MKTTAFVSPFTFPNLPFILFWPITHSFIKIMQMTTFQLNGNITDLFSQRLFWGRITVNLGKIERIEVLEDEPRPGMPFILPGFTDAHVHIESSMLVPAAFARLAVVQGTVSTISDPHEIANVCGLEGVNFMIDNGKTVPFKFNFGAPSCVPATTFETAGAVLDVAEVEALLQRKEIRYLSEMMNFPGVLYGDGQVMQKIAAAERHGKPIDGHAPGLRGDKAAQYIRAGRGGDAIVISTDHECFTAEEALDKLRFGMKILIREGSAAKNFEALIDLLRDYPDQMMFCSDDKHPDSLVLGHINKLCARAVEKGIPLFNVLQAACINPVVHYKTDVGLLQEGDAADFIVVRDLVTFEVLQTYIDGILVAENGQAADCYQTMPVSPINQFDCALKTSADFILPYKGEETIPVIEALDGQLITNRLQLPPKHNGRHIISDPGRDILKIVVVNRYREAPVAIAFVKHFGCKQGAIASSVAHDSHNIIAVGVDDDSLCRAVNLVITHQGGISVVGEMEAVLPLPVAGLMSTDDGYAVAEAYTKIDRMAKSLGSSLAAPFMTLSFMALLVIPHLKLSDLGLFDGDRFAFVTE
jgi:adenine deaminase